MAPPPLAPPIFVRTSSTLTACAIVCAGYSLPGWVSVWLLHHILPPEFAGVAPALGVPWLPVGMGIAGLMLFGVRAWPGILAGSCITWGLIQHDWWSVVLIDAAGESISIVLIVWLIRIWGYRPSLDRYQDALILVAAVALGRVVSSSVDIIASIAALWLDTRPSAGAILEAAGVGRSGDLLIVRPALLQGALRWWANSTVGAILVVPLLAFLAPAESRRRPNTRPEFVAWTLAACVWLIAALTLPGFASRLALLAAALVLVVWAALRFGVAIASVGTLVFSMAAALGFGFQLGTFAGIRGREGVEVVWGFIGLLTGAGLFVTALLSGLERVQRQSAAAVERSRRLFSANPTPMWAYEAATDRIVAVNAAAVSEYGYPEEAFLQLTNSQLSFAPAEAADSATQHARRATQVFAAAHRTAAGRELNVEVTSVPVEWNGTPLRVCQIDVIDERKDLRLAVLNATDLERHRLGQQIRERLGPTLERLDSTVGDLLQSVERHQAPSLDWLLSIEQDSVAATKMCRQLSRGASLIHFVSGDLIEALRRLPEELSVEGGPQIRVAVHAFATVRLPLERCEHVYGIARDAVRAAMLRPQVRSVSILVNVTATAIGLTIEDDGKPITTDAGDDASAAFAMAVRASAAQARIDVESSARGSRVSVECSQSDAPARDTVAGAARVRTRVSAQAQAVDVSAPRTPIAGTSGRTENPVQNLLHGLLLILVYVAAGALSLRFEQYFGSQRVWFVPVLAVPWVANGVAVAGLLLGGRRLAPAVFLASVALWGALAHDPWITVLLDGAGEMLCAMLVVHLLTRWGFHREFDRFRDLVLLLLAAAAGRTIAVLADEIGLHLAVVIAPGTLPATLFGLSTRDLRFVVTRQEMLASLGWWINGLTGITLFVPVVVSASARLRHALSQRWQEATLFSAALALTALTVAAGPSPTWRLLVLALSLVIVVWPALRFGMALASAATLVLSLAATVGYGLGRGPLASFDSAGGAGILWGFIGMLAATGFFLAIVVADYERNLRNLEALQARFEAFFEAATMPLFTYNEVGGRITKANAAAVNKYGYARAEFLNLHCAALVANAQSAGEAANTRHLTGRTVTSSIHCARSGAKFEVEQTATPVIVGGQTEILCFVVDVTERNDLRRRLLEASDVERRRLAHELHDGLGQILTGMSLGITTLRRAVERGEPPNAIAVQFVVEAIREARQSCEQIVHGLSPLEAAGGDLLTALRDLPLQVPPESRDKLTIDISAESELNIQLPMREHLYHIARECVNNALKHAEATRIRVTAKITSALVTLTIEDNGVGFDPKSDHPAGLGLQSLALRCEAVHGRLSVERRKEGGMEIRCQCPQPTA